MTQKIVTTRFHFMGGAVIPATTNAAPLVKKITAAAGSPTVGAEGGAAVLALSATNEVQNLCLYADDNLAFDIDDIVQFRAWVKTSVAIGTAAKWRVGLAAARNDDPDAITASILFGAPSTNAITCESDDGTNETAATATGISISTSWKKLVIDLSKGIHSQAPPSLSYGGKYAVQMFAENSSGLLVRVCESTRFNMGSHSSGLQPFVQLQKTAATDVGTLQVAAIEIDHRILS